MRYNNMYIYLCMCSSRRDHMDTFDRATEWQDANNDKCCEKRGVPNAITKLNTCRSPRVTRAEQAVAVKLTLYAYDLRLAISRPARPIGFLLRRFKTR